MIFRNHKLSAWQYINWIKISKYIEVLKSREHESFIEETDIKNSDNSLSLIKSEMVILASLKESLNDIDLKFNDFELGYLCFCCFNTIYCDISIFYYYRNSNNYKKFKLISFLLTKIHYSLILSYLHLYIIYLENVSLPSLFKLYELNDEYFRKKQLRNYRYYLFVDIKKYFSSLSLCSFLNKISLSKKVVEILLRLLNLGDSNQVKVSSVIDCNNYFMHSSRLVKKIIKIFVLCLKYEIFTILTCDLKSRVFVDKIIGVYNNEFLIFLSDNCLSLNLGYKITNLLSLSNICCNRNNIKWKYFLLQGISTNLFWIFSGNQSHTFYFKFYPSIKSQFILMKQISLTLFKSKSVSLFLLNIRLNMLAFLWVNKFVKDQVNKILYLLDYLISLKIRNVSNLFYNSTVELSKKILFINQRSHILYKKYLHLFIFLENKEYYKFYFLVKLLWIYQIND